jgi:hypothetical protein
MNSRRLIPSLKIRLSQCSCINSEVIGGRSHEISLVVADVRFGTWLRENSEIEFANGNFVSTSINLKDKSAGDGCRDKTIEKTILRTFRARTFSRSQGSIAGIVRWRGHVRLPSMADIPNPPLRESRVALGQQTPRYHPGLGVVELGLERTYMADLAAWAAELAPPDATAA